MRRQARISIGGALAVRTASALQVWLWLLIFVFQNEFRISRSIQPGYLDFDNLPDTNFTCEGKVIGGYYADLETSCQMFHVCTVGQQDEPMDIKFLCLNGTVFDQETRVCERVDEVDCTKSEKFYSLNLELYGSTLPPVTKTEPAKTPSSEKPSSTLSNEEADPSIDEPILPIHKNEKPQSEDTTEDPIDVNSEPPHKPPIEYVQPTHPVHSGLSDHVEPIEENEEEEEIDSENPDYDEDYSKTPTTTHPPSATTKTPHTTALPITSTPSQQPSLGPSASPPAPTHSSIASPTLSSSSSASPTLDPALLSPQEFIYRHRGPGSEAISFQRQSFRPADGVYITHAPPPQQQSFEHYQYESSRTAPRPASRPAPFAQRPPTPFRVTTLDPRDQLSRPGPSSQSSERHETAVKHRQQTYLPPLPAQRPLPFDPYYYDRKRSDEIHSENESSLAARSVAPPTVTERPPAKPKSPPRVIVTASASVSDSNGKRLNYTVGNVVSAVKPIVPINYDDYKESDLIFDPFFLDVPKLQKRRKTRGSHGKRNVFSLPATATISPELVIPIARVTTPRVTSQATTTLRTSTSPEPTSTTYAWNPDDYVNDNYEPQAYIPPIPPVVVLANERTKVMKQERVSANDFSGVIVGRRLKARTEEESKSKSSLAAQSTSSQIAAVAPSAPAPARRAHPVGLLCDGCRNRA